MSNNTLPSVPAFLLPTGLGRPPFVTGKSLCKVATLTPLLGASRSSVKLPSVCALGFGFFNPVPPDEEREKALPSPDALCACASGRAYGKCCRRFHTSQSNPKEAEDLLRSRYSAYAYRLPSYIMKTTHSSFAELDRRKWRKEIMTFCKDYQFVGGVDVIEMQVPGPVTTRILFRANLMERTAPISFLEMATFTRERNIWYYKSGKLVDIDDR